MEAKLHDGFQTLRADSINELPNEFKESWFCLKKAGLPCMPIHDLHHSQAFYLIKQEVNIYVARPHIYSNSA